MDTCAVYLSAVGGKRTWCVPRASPEKQNQEDDKEPQAGDWGMLVGQTG